MSDWGFSILAGLSALFGAVVIGAALFKDRARGRLRCPKCWYDMSGADCGACPECGKPIRRPRALRRTRRHWRWVAFGLLVMIGAVSLALTPKVRREGFWSIMPDTVVIAALPYFDDDSPWQEMDARFDRAWSNGLPPGVMYDWQWRFFRERCLEALVDDDRPVRRDLAAGMLWMAPHHRLEPHDELAATLAEFIDDAPRPGSFLAERMLGTDGTMSDEDAVVVVEALVAYAETAAGAAKRVVSLGRLHAAAPAVVARFAPRLAALLDDPDPVLRGGAAQALGLIADPDEATVRAVLDAAHDVDSDVRFAIMTTLGAWLWWSGDRAPTMPQSAPRRVATYDLVMRDEIIGALWHGLDDPHAEVRFGAARSLHGLVDPTPEMVARLIELAEAEDAHGAALTSLGSYGTLAGDVVPFLKRYVRDPSNRDRRAALTTLGSAGAGRTDVLDVLLDALDDPDGDVVRGAVHGLEHFPTFADRIVEPLTQVLHDHEGNAARRALWTLASFGDASSSALPRVRELAIGPSSGMEIWALFAWWRIEGDAELVLPHVIDFVERWGRYDSDTYVLGILVEMGPAASDALPALREALDREPARRAREALEVTIEALEGEG